MEGKNTYIQKNEMEEKVKKIKEAIREIEKIKNNIESIYKNAYIVELYSEANKYYLVIRDSSWTEIFEKELDENEYDNLRVDTIDIYIRDKIEEILENLRRNKIIEDYFIDLQVTGEEEFGHNHEISYLDCYIYVYLDKKTLKEIEKDDYLRDYLEDDEDSVDYEKYLLISMDNLINFEAYYIDSFNERHHAQSIIYYVTKEEAERLIKNLSK